MAFFMIMKFSQLYQMHGFGTRAHISKLQNCYLMLSFRDIGDFILFKCIPVRKVGLIVVLHLDTSNLANVLLKRAPKI